MKKIIIIDAETDPFAHGRTNIKPFIWGAYEDEFGFRWFDTTREMVDWCKTQDAYIFAHNGGKFDFLFMLDHFEARSEIRIINGRIAQFKIGKATFRDSFLILPIPLKDFKKDKIDYSIMEASARDKVENRRKIIKYLKSDCEYLHQLVSHFYKEYGSKLTLASAAMTQWQKISGVKAPDTTAGFFDENRLYYFGGRVECFKAGIVKRKIKVFDINSAYPFAMVHEHPFGVETFTDTKLPSTRPAIERSFIDLTADSLGAFPYLGEKGLGFPNDGQQREFKITGWEYLAASETGRLRNARITKVKTFANTINFRSYVDHFYELKSKAEKGTPAYISAKLFLNGLYGKFAANPNKYKRFLFVEPNLVDYFESISEFGLVDFVGNWALMAANLAEFQMRFYNVATGASITGFVRAYALRALDRAQGLCYMDTDGIHAEAIPALPISKALGDWNVEFEADQAAYAGKKLYALLKFKGKKLDDVKLASKGVRLNAAQIYKLARGGVVKYRQKAPSMSVRKGFVSLARDIKATVEISVNGSEIEIGVQKA